MNSNIESSKTIEEEKKTLFGLNADEWGWISVFTNGFSVIFQMNQLLRTQKAQSFDMNFISLMTLDILFCVNDMLVCRDLEF